MTSIADIDRMAMRGPYTPDWASLSRHGNNNPQWFAEAKFGIFVHWGLYSIPAFRNEWYPRNMYIEGYPEFTHHRDVYGPHDQFGYQDFIPLFQAENFDADNWCELFARAGARYMMMVSEHHDGFQMYASDISRYNSARMGPRRDIVGELKDAARGYGLHFTLSNHRAEHWWFMGHGKNFCSDIHEPLSCGDFYWPAMAEANEFDIASEPAPSRQFLDDWLLRNVEIVDRYQPELLYFDWWVQHLAFKEHLKRFAAYYYNRAAQRNVQAAICYKYDALAWGAGIVDVERGGFAEPTSFPWQTDTAIARNSWCYTDCLDYKTLPELLATLVDTVSKNGNMLLNVGPRADGTIAGHDRKLLEGIGDWLAVNGEAIYGTRPWKIAGEGPTTVSSGAFADGQATVWTANDWRFTSHDGNIYACCLNPGHCDELTVRSLASFDGEHQPCFNDAIDSVKQLGAGPARYCQDAQGLHIQPERSAGQDPHLPMVFRLRCR